MMGYLAAALDGVLQRRHGSVRQRVLCAGRRPLVEVSVLCFSELTPTEMSALSKSLCDLRQCGLDVHERRCIPLRLLETSGGGSTSNRLDVLGRHLEAIAAESPADLVLARTRPQGDFVLCGASKGESEVRLGSNCAAIAASIWSAWVRSCVQSHKRDVALLDDADVAAIVFRLTGAGTDMFDIRLWPDTRREVSAALAKCEHAYNGNNVWNHKAALYELEMLQQRDKLTKARYFCTHELKVLLSTRVVVPHVRMLRESPGALVRTYMTSPDVSLTKRLAKLLQVFSTRMELALDSLEMRFRHALEHRHLHRDEVVKQGSDLVPVAPTPLRLFFAKWQCRLMLPPPSCPTNVYCLWSYALATPDTPLAATMDKFAGFANVV